MVYCTAFISNDVHCNSNDNDFVMTFTSITDKSYDAFSNFYIQYSIIDADEDQDIGPENINCCTLVLFETYDEKEELV